MNRIFRSNSSTSSRCNQPTSIPDIPADVGAINSETYELSDLDLDIGDWNIPKVAISQFYKSSKRGVSYNNWKSGDWALKPGNAEGKNSRLWLTMIDCV